jgi:hypothetical protein
MLLPRRIEARPIPKKTFIPEQRADDGLRFKH